MKITDVEVIVLEHNWGPPEEGVTREWPLMLVHTDEGISGLGRGGDPEIVRNELAPLLIGQDPRRTAMLWQMMYDHAWRFRGPDRAAMTSIGSLDIALWDIVGKASGQPVWRLLGGYTDRVEVYADGIGYVDEDPETVGATREEARRRGLLARQVPPERLR